MISADEPEMPAPAGASESVSKVNPSGAPKNRNTYASKGSFGLVARLNSSSDPKLSSAFKSSDRSVISLPGRVSIRHVVNRFTAKFTVTAPG